MSKTALPSDLLVVLGPHRSGSSALTRAMSLLGYNLPKTLIKDNSSNRRGHWESRPIVRHNDAYMQDAQVVWSDWVSGDLQKVPAQRQRDFEADLTAIIADEFTAEEPAILKDPRLCRLMARYRNALDGKTDLKVVVSVRNPLEVMGSLMLRNNMSKGNAALLWLRYTLDAVNDSEGLPRAFISYERMLRDPIQQFEVVAEVLKTEYRHKISNVKDDITTFLNAGFRNQQSTNEDLLHNDLTNGMVSDTYDALRILTHDPSDAKSLQTIKEVSDNLAASERLLDHIMRSYDAELSGAKIDAESASAAADLRREQIAALREKHREFEETEASLRLEMEQTHAKSEELEAELTRKVDDLRAETASQQTKLDEAAAKHNELEDARAALKTEVALAKSQSSDMETALRGELKKTSERSKKAEKAAAKQYGKLQDVERSLRREVKRLRERSGELEAEAASHLHNYLAVTGSTSWRITRPLRSLISRLRGGGAVPKEAPMPATAKPIAESQEDEPPAATVAPSKAEDHLALLKASSIFDADYYLEQYPDAQKDTDGPAAHYLNTGWRKGFDPSALFVTKAYEHSHADLLKNDECPAIHFINRYAETYKTMASKQTKTPRIAVFSAVVGAYDHIKDPVQPADGVDFFMFTDGLVPKGSVWKSRRLEYVDADPTRSARFVKTHPHLYFADYDYAIWMDANLALNTQATELLAMVDPSKPIHSWKHPLRICVFEEARTCMELNKDGADIIRADMERLHEEKFPRHAGLFETSIVVTTMSHPDVAKFYSEWWARIDRGSRRDQLSLPPAIRSAGVDVGFIAPERICMRTDPRVIYKRHIHNDRERLLQGKAA